jgi:hypothetical protein
LLLITNALYRYLLGYPAPYPHRFGKSAHEIGPSRSQSILFPAITATEYAKQTITLDATASSKLSVSYTSTTPKVCTISRTKALLLTAGTCTIKAAQAGNDVYATATEVSRSFKVLAAK